MTLTTMPAMALVRAEFLRNLRGGRPYLFLGLLVLVGWFIVWANFPSGGQQLAMLGRASEEILIIFSMVVLISAGLFVPALAATAIVSEREQETYDQLALTLIPPKGIIAAKFLNAVGLYLAVVVGAVPVLATVFFMVGLDIRLVLVFVAILLMGILSTAAIGIAASAYSRRSLQALILAYLATLFFMGGHDFLLIVAYEVLHMRIVPVNSNSFMTFAMATSPPVTLAGMYDNWGSMHGFYWACCYHAAIVAICFAITVVCIRRGPRAAPTERGGTRWMPGYGRRFRAIGDRVNAMTVKELRWGLLRRRRAKALLWTLSLGLFLVINATIVSEYRLYNMPYSGYPSGYPGEALLVSFLFFMVILLPAVPVFLTNLLTKERETHSMDMLRITLLTPRQVVYGKVVAGLRGMTPIVISFALAELMLAWPIIERGEEKMLIAGIVTTAVSMLFTVGVATYAGAAARRTSTGLVAAYAAVLLAFLGLPLLAVTFCEAVGISSSEAEVLVAALSPIISYIVHLESKPQHEFIWLIVMTSYSIFGIYFLVKSVHRYARYDD